ncbi:FAD-dependent monooxygenase [Nocardia sp. R7R-8]|uniref:FAD-dependent monooxygenase n=1 Tax=Nocardia sp. R7R-8 TaxID=3459304 RepID=UPI00403D61B7
MSVKKHAAIVGAGLAGLGTAVGLLRGGWQVTVLECAPKFGPVGSGISMYPNAMRALEALGFADQLRDLPPFDVGHSLHATSGACLTKISGAAVRKIWGGQIYGFYRADLHELLRSGLPDDAIRLGVAVTAAEPGANGKWLLRSGDDVVLDDADVVVVADGIASRLRKQYWPDLPNESYTGSTAWRGVSPTPEEFSNSIVQTFGTGMEFGYLPLTDGRTYWYASCLTPPGQRNEDERAAVRELYADWHEPIPALIDTAEAVLHHDINALPVVPSTLVHDQLVLVGDAGHGMTPHLGQGGCTALEDAVVLAVALIDSPGDIAAALARYDEQRQPRVSELARIAEDIRRMSHESSEADTEERNRTWPRLAPEDIYRTSADVAQWFPPAVIKA